MRDAETKHTPGPWRAVDLHPAKETCGVHFEIFGHSDYKHGGEYIVARVDATLTTPAATTANAHLIAAAPEMLEALEACKVELEILAEMFPKQSEHRRLALVVANEAINKAKGLTQ